MKPLEIERPWIKAGKGKKLFAVIVIVLIATVGILSVFDFYNGTTVNIQAVDVSVTESGNTIANFSFAYGKFTYGAHQKVSISIIFPTNLSKYMEEHNHYVDTVLINTKGFTNSGFSNNTSGSKDSSIIVNITTPDKNFYGTLNLGLELN